METSKRKHAEDICFLSKKPRVDNHDGDFNINRQVCPRGASENTPLFSSSIEVEMPDDLPPTCATAERAIVVYKPTNSELFLSNSIPRAPKVQLDMRIFTPDARQQLGMLRTNPIGLDSGSTFELPLKGALENRLAVVPWVPSPPNMPATGVTFGHVNGTRASQIGSKAMKEDEVMGEGASEIQAMDEDNGITEIQSVQPSNPISKFGTESWHQYGVLQPQTSSVT